MTWLHDTFTDSPLAWEVARLHQIVNIVSFIIIIASPKVSRGRAAAFSTSAEISNYSVWFIIGRVCTIYWSILLISRSLGILEASLSCCGICAEKSLHDNMGTTSVMCYVLTMGTDQVDDDENLTTHTRDSGSNFSHWPNKVTFLVWSLTIRVLPQFQYTSWALSSVIHGTVW